MTLPDFLYEPLWRYEVFALLVLYPAWVIFRRAGFPGWYALAVFVPYAGNIICAAYLAFTRWPAAGGEPVKEG